MGERTQRALAQVDASLREGAPATLAPPTRFYLNLTERCPLRCRHCLTRAPQKTASGEARDMSMSVVDALRPHFAHAAYLGFPHAGEPLVSPALEPVLLALREARAGEPTAVHLLTNGLALTKERFLHLSGLGVNSWSISIDGMTAATHDALRVGSSIEQLLSRLRSLCLLREASHKDARVGVAWTITRANIGEIPQLLEFSAASGLDWVKLEEMFAHDETSHAEAQIAPEHLRLALEEARAQAKSLGVRLLEHVFETAVWKCRLDSDEPMARFSRLDDFANRMEINPCRLPYELVCVEPDGDLKPMSFHAPAAGNLLREGLPACWNAAPFAEARSQARARRLCGEGPATCGSDPGPERW
jgi:MoaA/NifB/PqqE/SkfB family radical SAM enzyme